MSIISIAGKDIPSAEEISALADSIRLEARTAKLDSEMKKLVDNLPSRRQILADLDEIQLSLLYQNIKYIWETMSGKSIDTTDTGVSNGDFEALDGNYWYLPGDIILGGFNHFSIARTHRNLVCSLLDINPLVFEQKLTKYPDELIGLIIARGGIRMRVEKSSNTVFMQSSPKSWVWARDKLKKMHHKKRVIKIVDLKVPYEGWRSGVTILLKSTPEF